jgi:hypothetical protein
MKSAYKYLAGAIPVLVAVQAAAIAFAFFGLGKWIEDGGTLDKAAMEDEDLTFTGVLGFMVHGINGQMVIPLVALILLIVAFFAKIPGGVKWAAFILVDVIVQIAFAFGAFGAPAIGMFHGLNALFLAWLGYTAMRRVGTATTASVSYQGESVGA